MSILYSMQNRMKLILYLKVIIFEVFAPSTCHFLSCYKHNSPDMPKILKSTGQCKHKAINIALVSVKSNHRDILLSTMSCYRDQSFDTRLLLCLVLLPVLLLLLVASCCKAFHCLSNPQEFGGIFFLIDPIQRVES